MKAFRIKDIESVASRLTTEESSVVQRFIRIVSLFLLSFPRHPRVTSLAQVQFTFRRESIATWFIPKNWIPAFAGMTNQMISEKT